MLHENAFRYVECDVPEGVTLERWRSARVESPPRRRLVRLVPLRLGLRRGAERSREDEQA
jgi:hypothetical protein